MIGLKRTQVSQQLLEEELSEVGEEVLDMEINACQRAKKQYEKGKGQKRPLLRDFKSDIKSALDISMHIYRCLVCTCDPFPTLDQELAMVKEAWEAACKEADLNACLTPDMHRLVRVCKVLFSC